MSANCSAALMPATSCAALAKRSASVASASMMSLHGRKTLGADGLFRRVLALRLGQPHAMAHDAPLGGRPQPTTATDDQRPQRSGTSMRAAQALKAPAAV